MMSTLQQQLITSKPKSFLNFLFVLIYGGDIRFGVTRNPVKVAEFTVRNANICSINIPVDNPGHKIILLTLFSQFIANNHQLRSGSMQKKKFSFCCTQKIAVKGPLQQLSFILLFTHNL